MADQDRIPLEDVESLIRSVDGVDRVKVSVNDWGAIEAVHVLGDQRRPAKRVIRDIESALAAQLGIMVDHRKISLAQVASARHGGGSGPRLVYAGHRVEVDRTSGQSWLHVRLARDDTPEPVFEGSAEGRGAGTRLRQAAVEAALAAVTQAVHEELWLDAARHDPVRREEGRIWLVSLTTRVAQEREEMCAGAAVERDGDDVGAIVEATLNAVGPVLERLTLRSLPDASVDGEGEPAADDYVEVDP